MNIESKIKMMEKRLDHYARENRRLYNTLYAIRVRRLSSIRNFDARMNNALRALRFVDKSVVKKLTIIARNIQKGKRVVCLDGRQHMLLEVALRRQHEFKSRKPRKDAVLS